MEQTEIDDAAMFLLHLRTQRTQVTGLPGEIAPKTLDDAYAIQDAYHRFSGEPIGLTKIGCTSAIAQQVLGIPHPIAGRITTAGVFRSGASVPASFLHTQPLLECEIAVRIDASGAVDAYAPAIELVNARFSDTSKVSGPSLVADNSAGTAAVLGDAIEVADAPDLTDLAISLTTDSEQIAAGSTAALLGGVDSQVSWIADHEASHGRTLEAGSWIITGTCTGLTPAPFGATYTADFGPLGRVSFSLGDAA